MAVLSIHSKKIQPPLVKRHVQLRNTKTSGTSQAFFQAINLPRETIIGYLKDVPNQQSTSIIESICIAIEEASTKARASNLAQDHNLLAWIH